MTTESPLRAGVLETPRLVLRPMRSQDAVVHHRLWRERDPRVPAHRRPDEHGRPTVADLTAQLAAAGAASEADPSAPALLGVVLRETSATLGYCGLSTQGPGGTAEPELAFELLRACHGQGLGTECATAVVSLARTQGHPRLWATVWDWNEPSRRVLASLGFREVQRRDVGQAVSLTTVLSLRDEGGDERVGALS